MDRLLNVTTAVSALLLLSARPLQEGPASRTW